MNEEYQRAVEILSKEYEQEKIKRMNLENQYSQVSAFSSNTQSNNFVAYQLDLSEELDRIHHLLSGHILEKSNNGGDKWTEPEDDRLKIFSEYGVKQIMNIISFYINKNTLLSNYDEETIKWKVRDFGIELSDLIFGRYEVFFSYPSPEELFDKYSNIARVLNVDLTDEEIYSKCVEWSNQEMQSKLRHYPMILLSIVDSVHSTYLRALKGQERTSLRQQTMIHQSSTSNNPQETQVKPGGILR